MSVVSRNLGRFEQRACSFDPTPELFADMTCKSLQLGLLANMQLLNSALSLNRDVRMSCQRITIVHLYSDARNFSAAHRRGQLSSPTRIEFRIRCKCQAQAFAKRCITCAQIARGIKNVWEASARTRRAHFSNTM